MILDKAVLGAIASRWADGMFSSRWGNLIARWCVSYYNKYHKAPGKNIQNIYDQWSSGGGRDNETVEEIGTLLRQLSGQYSSERKSINPSFVIDTAAVYFNRVKLRELKDQLEAALETGELEQADTLLSEYSKIELGVSHGINVLEDREAIERAFLTKNKPIIKHRHGLKLFFGNALERDAFVAFMGPEKRGKTWQLLDLAWRAMVQGRKVAFFEVGDLSESQIMRRFMIRAARSPMEPRTIKWPVAIFPADHSAKSANVEHKEIVFPDGLDFQLAWEACQRIAAKNKGDLKLSIHPNSSISVNGIRNIVETWGRNGWIPDVIIIDYADILAGPPGVSDGREQINATWKGLRALSQELHCLVVTATQAKASSYSTFTMSKQDFAEDKRKFAHVTGMVGLNCTPEEKSRGLMRYNWLVLREEDYSETACCHIASCFSVANPTVMSVMA